jgi:hypothetical protein
MRMVYQPDSIQSRYRASLSQKQWNMDYKDYNPDKGSKLFVATVDCFPLQSLLLAANFSTIDFLSLNLEGVELKVLKTLDWEKIAVKVSYSLWS